MTRRTARAAGWLLCTAALVLAGVAFGRDLLADPHAAQAQSALRAELHDRQPVPLGPGRVPAGRPAPSGQALAELRIPRFGPSWSWIVVEGTTPTDLATGPGHYTGTPLPGERGNVSIAAHRAGHGDPFLDFDTLRPGDEIVLRQGTVTWTYAITTAPEIVSASAGWVLDPLPGRQLTLTTCWPKYGSSKRMYVRATLARWTESSARRSAELVVRR